MKINKVKCENCIKEGLKFTFNNHVIRQDGCWDWKGWRDKKGYPCLGFRSKNVFGHRASWMIHHGEIPTGLLVLHKCDNPICTNPDHLFLGTHSDNRVDMYAKNRQGEGRLTGDKLSHADVQEIRKMAKEGKSNREIAWHFGISECYTIGIKKGKNFKSLPFE